MKNYSEISDYAFDLQKRHGDNKKAIITEAKQHPDFAYIEAKTIIRTVVECVYFYCDNAPKRIALLINFKK